MEHIDLPSKTDCNIDLGLCFTCAVCNFMTYNAEHLEKHTTAMHHGMPPKIITKIISESNNTSTKQAGSLSTLTHDDDIARVNFPTKERDDIPFHSSSTKRLEYIDNDTEVVSHDLKPSVKDLSNMLSKINDSFKTFNSSCVKIELEHDDKMFSDINQSTLKQETMLPSFSDGEVKDEVMHCQSCSYKDVDSGKLKSHIFTHHATEAAVITNCFVETDLNIHGVKFFCIKETCSFSTTLCNVYQQHLLCCCSIHQIMTRIETERLRSTITFVLDFHNKLGLDPVFGFLEFVSSFSKIYASNTDQGKIREALEYGSSSSILSESNYALFSDVKSCLSCDDGKRNSECSFSSVPGTVLLANVQNTNLSSEVGQTETMCVVKQDDRNVIKLIKTDLSATTFPSSSEREIINIESSIDHLVSNNVELENDIAGKPFFDNDVSLSEEMRKDNIKDEVNCDAKCNKCVETLSQDSNLLLHTGKLDEEKRFKCGKCTKGISGENIPLTHMGIYKEKRRLKCRECDKSFSRKGTLTVHMRVHTGEKPFNCKECGIGFSQKSSLTVHMRVHEGEKPFRCNECGKSFRGKGILRVHKRVHTGEKPYICIECGKNFSQKSSLTVHMSLHTGEKPFMCNECGKSFCQKSKLVVHMRIHTGEKPFMCNECGKRFSQKTSLTVHMGLHIGERPFMCNECGIGFSQKGKLTVHMRVHEEEKPFKCNECGRGFSLKGKLTKHMRLHTAEKLFECNDCSKRFISKSKLTIHMRLHTGEKPFRCNECGKCFREKSTLSKHMKIRRGDKLFECIDCGRGFCFKSSFTKHLRIHTREKPFKSDEYGKSFRERSKLTVHKKRHIKKC